MLTVTNQLIMNPTSFVPILEAMLPKFNGMVYDNYLTTQEGAPAVQEAIDALNAITTPIAEAMTWDQYVEFECLDHVAGQSLTTDTGHTSPNGDTMTMRFAKYGQFVSTVGENIAYGTSVA